MLWNRYRGGGESYLFVLASFAVVLFAFGGSRVVLVALAGVLAIARVCALPTKGRDRGFLKVNKGSSTCFFRGWTLFIKVCLLLFYRTKKP
jgi:hypothetical protein